MTRSRLYGVMLMLAIGSVAVYLDALLRPPASTPAAMFVLAPPVSWLLMAVVIPAAAFISRPSR